MVDNRSIRVLVRFRHGFLLSAVLLNTFALRDDADWGLLTSSGKALFGEQGLHVYAADPGLQAGPPTLLLVRIIALLPPRVGLYLVWTTLALVGWYVFRLAEREGARRLGLPDPSASPAYALGSLALGLPLLTTWSTLAGGCPHLEDGLTILASTAALLAIDRGKGTRAALLIGAAMALKPWGIAALPLLSGLPEQRRRAVLLACLVPAMCWLPFLVDDPDTLRAAGHAFTVSGSSALRVFGLSSDLAPPWLRTVQLLGVLGVATGVAVRGNWRQAFAAGCAVRLLLDPGTYDYYTAGLLLVIGVTEKWTAGRGWRTAWLTVGLVVVPQFATGLAMAAVRVALLGVVVTGWLVRPHRAQPGKPLVPTPRPAAEPSPTEVPTCAPAPTAALS